MGIASDNYARLTRDMWAAWVANFLPIENRLVEYAMDRDLAAKQAEKAQESVREAFELSALRQARGIRVPLTPEEQAAADRQRAMAQSLAEVNAANVARQATLSRQRQLIGIGMPQPEQFQLPVGR